MTTTTHAGPLTLRLRAADIAKERGLAYRDLYRLVWMYGGIHDAALRRILSGENFMLAFQTIAILAQAFEAEGWPMPPVEGDPNDGRTYLYWWERPVDYPAATTEPLPPERDS